MLDTEGVDAATIAIIGSPVPAMMFAAQHPERVLGLVLYGGSLSGPLIDDQADGWTPHSARVCARAWRAAGDTWGSGETTRPWDTGLCSAYNLRLIGMGERCSVGEQLAREHIEAYLSADARAIASSVRVPTRVLGRPDNAAPLATMRALADAIPNALYAELPVSRLGDSIGDAWVPVARHVAEVARGESARYGVSERALTTVLFTGIVGSTEALTRTGDAACAQILGSYHQLIRREVTAAGGRIVATTGDGTLCELPAPAAAIRAAGAICHAGRALDVETRAGVHVGECERIGDDLAGITVHVGARISALAGPGEVRVSRTVRDLIDGSDLNLEPCGARELKGVPGRWHLFMVSDDTDRPVSTIVPPQPTEMDRLIVQLARRSPRALRGVNRIGSALQRRALAGVEGRSSFA